MKVLSLFDGISCGMVALERAGIPVERYVAYEIEQSAIQISKHNYPQIEQCGDVFNADFTQYKGFDLLIGGSPCTFWSIAKGNRETTPDGIGGQLFMQYVRALKESGCKYFFYENNYSIHNNIKSFISEQLGVQPVMINSALVSAQRRKRCYWTNIPGVQQPCDKGILLKDILEHGACEKEKAYCLCTDHMGTTRDYFKKHQSQVVFEPVRIGTIENNSKNSGHDSQQYRVYSCYGKSVTLCGNGGGIGAKTGLYFTPLPNELIGLVCDKGKIYEIKNSLIVTKSGTWTCNMPDGFYMIRKLTPIEAERLQTLPDNYTKAEGVSNQKRYKGVGNGWTVDVIAHIFKGLNVSL